MAARGIPRLFVGNIPWSIGRKELREYFAQFGQIQHTHVFFDKSTGMSRNFGFVQFVSRDGYTNSTRQPEHLLEGSRLTVADVHQTGSRQNNQFGESNAQRGSGSSPVQRRMEG